MAQELTKSQQDLYEHIEDKLEEFYHGIWSVGTKQSNKLEQLSIVEKLTAQDAVKVLKDIKTYESLDPEGATLMYNRDGKLIRIRKPKSEKDLQDLADIHEAKMKDLWSSNASMSRIVYESMW